MVESIDRKNRIVNVNTGHVMISNTGIQREYAKPNMMKTQNRTLRYVEGFDLKDYRPKVNKLNAENFIDKFKNIIEKQKINKKALQYPIPKQPIVTIAKPVRHATKRDRLSNISQ